MLFILFVHQNITAAVAYPCGRSEKHRCLVFFRVIKGVLYHLVCLLRRGRIKHRQLTKVCKVPCILLCLGGYGARIVGGDYHHRTLYPHICKTHKRVGCHIQSNLLHGDKDPCSCICSSGSHLKGCLFVYAPLHMDRAVVVFCHRFKYLRRGSTRVTCHKVHPCVDSSQSDSFVTH